MRFAMAGKKYIIENLDPVMDEAFINLHAAFLSNHSYNLDEFKKLALGFFSRNGGNVSAHDKFFNNFTIIWHGFLRDEHFDEAELVWDMALQPALEWEGAHQGNFIHKGTPFYFWGVTAILKGNLDRGYSFIHQALEEDARTSGKSFPHTPAYAFATLDYTNPRMAFRELLLPQVNFLDNLLTIYRSTYSKKLQLEDFRKRFLLKPPSIDAIFLFAYSLARLLRLNRTPSYALASSFASLLEINLLFDVSLVIDEAIKGKNPSQWQFIDHAAFLSQKSGLGLSKLRLVKINDRFKRNFDLTLTELLDGAFKFQDGSGLSKEESDLAISYGLRNHGAHNISASSVIQNKFKDAQQSVFNVLFFCVEMLY